VTPLVLAFHFGGFAPDGASFVKLGADGDRVCAVVTGAEAAACRPITKAEIRSGGFARPERGGRGLSVALRDDHIEVTQGARVIATWKPTERLLSVNANVFVAPGGAVVAVEYQSSGGADVIAVALKPTPASEPASAPAGGGNAYDRAVAKGGVWEQAILPCDQAGVQLRLKKNRKFDLAITTRCQGDRNATNLAGAWSSEGNDTLILSFENANAPTETLPCRLMACADASGEDCLSCCDEDISFALKSVRR
jgi:hypothetical protein